MFTAKTLHHTVPSTDALRFAALALYLSQLSLAGTILPDFFDALRFPALLPWMPALLVVGGRVPHRIPQPHGRQYQPTTVGGVRAITAMVGVVILTASAAAYGISTCDPVTLELAPASAAFAHEAITT